MSESFNDRLEAYFRAREGVWINGMELAKVAGHFAWRTRVSNVRQRGLTIENRQRRVTNAQGKVYTVSEYRYTSARPLLAQMEQPSA